MKETPCRDFFTFITRPKVIILLICLMVLAAVIATIIPQIGSSSSIIEQWQRESPQLYALVDFLQINRVYTSAWFLLLVILVQLSLGGSLVRQVRTNSKKRPPAFPATDQWQWCSTPDSLVGERLTAYMKSRGYSLESGDKNQYLFSKYAFARWGPVFLHGGLFLIICAGILGLVAQQRGFARIIEGDRFAGKHEDFGVTELGLLQKRFDTGFTLFLDEFHHEYWDTDSIKKIYSTVVFLDEDGQKVKEEKVAVNHPVDYKGVRLHQSFDYGYTVSFVLVKPEGSEIQTNFILGMQKKKSEPAVGSAGFPGTEYIFRMQFYPDVSKQSFQLGNPIMHLRVQYPGGREVFEGLVVPGDMLRAEGKLFRFNRISHWSGLIFEKSPDMSIAYAGLILVCLGAILIFFFIQREIVISVQAGEMGVYGRTKRFKAIFREELEGMKKDMVKLC